MAPAPSLLGPARFVGSGEGEKDSRRGGGNLSSTSILIDASRFWAKPARECLGIKEYRRVHSRDSCRVYLFLIGGVSPLMTDVLR